MQLNVNDDTKIAEIWLSSHEKNDPEIQARLEEVCKKYKRTHLVAVYISGQHDLYHSTRDLLTYNMRRCAQLEVQRQKTQPLDPLNR